MGGILIRRRRPTREQILEMIERSKPKYCEIEPLSFEEELLWLKQRLDEGSSGFKISACEGDYRFYLHVEEWVRNLGSSIYPRNIEIIAGPVLLVPEEASDVLDQRKRAMMSPISRLAKDTLIYLYPARRRVPTRSYFIDGPERALAFTEAEPGERPEKAVETINTHFGAGFAYLDLLGGHVSGIPERDCFEHDFVFLTESEFEAFKKWAKRREGRYIDLKEYSLKDAKEFWEEYVGAVEADKNLK